jgi:CubicO group peptidase (beta-lactamase class C family)
MDVAAVRAAAAAQERRPTPGTGDIGAYCAAQNRDTTHRELLGPLLPASGPAGVVRHRGTTLATWGDPAVPEMAFSATKTFVSLVAGLAWDEGLLATDEPVGPIAPGVTWHHLLQQTSGWDGELWGKPAAADAQSHGVTGAPGACWAYDDVRVNLLCLLLTRRWGQELPAVLDERVMRPIGASGTWRWYGYDGATIRAGGRDVRVVSGGAHWGGGLWISAADLALVGDAVLASAVRGDGPWSRAWLRRSWTPCDVKPDYGYLWWLAPAGPVYARGNLGRHVLWLDPAAELVVVSRWGEDVGELLAAVSAAASVP